MAVHRLARCGALIALIPTLILLWVVPTCWAQSATTTPAPPSVEAQSGDGVDWGTVPAWITAGTALLAWITAMGAFSVAYVTWRNTKAKQNAELAVKVAAWVEKYGSHGAFMTVLNNGSDQPIYGVSGVINGYGELTQLELADFERAVIPPGQHHVREIPAHDARLTRGPDVVLGEIDERGVLPHDFRVELRFTDAVGKRWKRNHNGGLEAVR